MFTATRAAAVLAFIGLVMNGVNAASECTTVDSGYLSMSIARTDGPGFSQGFRLNGSGDVTVGTGKFFKGQFQACADLPQSDYYNSVGRIVIEGSDNKCLTISNADSTTGPWYAKAETCSSSTEPSAAQTFGYGVEYGQILAWNIDCGKDADGGGAGVAVVIDWTHAVLGAGNLVEFTCTSDTKTSYEPFTFDSSPYTILE